MRSRMVLATWAIFGTLGCAPEGHEGSERASPVRAQVVVSGDASITGVIRNIAGRHGGAPFTAVLAISEFVGEQGAVYGIGQLSQVGGLSPAAIQSLTAQPLKLPVSLVPLPSDGGVRTIEDGGASCPVLALMVKPTTLDLAGVRVELGEIDLGAKAVSGASNLLGNILCGIFGTLAPSGLLTGLDPIVAERISGFLNGLAGGIVEGIVDAVHGEGQDLPGVSRPLVLFGLDGGLPAR